MQVEDYNCKIRLEFDFEIKRVCVKKPTADWNQPAKICVFGASERGLKLRVLNQSFLENKLEEIKSDSSVPIRVDEKNFNRAEEIDVESVAVSDCCQVFGADKLLFFSGQNQFDNTSYSLVRIGERNLEMMKNWLVLRNNDRRLNMRINGLVTLANNYLVSCISITNASNGKRKDVLVLFDEKKRKLGSVDISSVTSAQYPLICSRQDYVCVLSGANIALFEFKSDKQSLDVITNMETGSFLAERSVVGVCLSARDLCVLTEDSKVILFDTNGKKSVRVIDLEKIQKRDTGKCTHPCSIAARTKDSFVVSRCKTLFVFTCTKK